MFLRTPTPKEKRKKIYVYDYTHRYTGTRDVVVFSARRTLKYRCILSNSPRKSLARYLEGLFFYIFRRTDYLIAIEVTVS